MYQDSIKEQLEKMGYEGKYDPRHIEAYMRLDHSTLDGLSKKQFTYEVEVCRRCVDFEGAEEAEALAKTYGL